MRTPTRTRRSWLFGRRAPRVGGVRRWSLMTAAMTSEQRRRWPARVRVGRRRYRRAGVALGGPSRTPGGASVGSGWRNPCGSSGSTARLRFRGGGVESRAACSSSAAAGWRACGRGHPAACEQVVHVRWGRQGGGRRVVGGEGVGGRARRRCARTGAAARGRDRYAAAERAEAVQRQRTGAVRARRLQRGTLAGLVGTRAACDGWPLAGSQNAPCVRYTLRA